MLIIAPKCSQMLKFPQIPLIFQAYAQMLASPENVKRHSGIIGTSLVHSRLLRLSPSQGWDGDFDIWAPGIRPNPSESDSLPDASESGTHFCWVETPIPTVRCRKKIPCGTSRNPPESVRIRPSTESVRIPNRHPSHSFIGYTLAKSQIQAQL